MVSVGQELRSGLAGAGRIRVSPEVVIRCWPGLQSSDGPSGAGRLMSMVTHVMESWFFLLWASSGHCWGVLMTRGLAFLRASDPRDQGTETPVSFMT